MRDKKINTIITSIEEVALYQMFLSEALFEIFLQKGLITDAEVKEQIRKMRSNTGVTLGGANGRIARSRSKRNG